MNEDDLDDVVEAEMDSELKFDMDSQFKEQLISLSDAIGKEINLAETPVMFRWSYEERPEIEFQLSMSKVEGDNPLLESRTIH